MFIYCELLVPSFKNMNKAASYLLIHGELNKPIMKYVGDIHKSLMQYDYTNNIISNKVYCQNIYYTY